MDNHRDAEDNRLCQHDDVVQKEVPDSGATQALVTKNALHVDDEVTDSAFGWTVVFASFICHAIFFGVNLAFGVIYIELLEYFNKNRGETAWIGSIPKGLLCFMSSIAGLLAERYGCRIVTIAGGVIACCGFIISSFATSMSYLYFSFGAVAGSGLGLMFLPSRVIINQYMTKRRALANSFASSGGGIGTIFFSFVFHVLYDHFGLRGMFLITGAIVLNATVCGALYRPLTRTRKQAEVKQDTSTAIEEKKCCSCTKSPILNNGKFLLFILSNFTSSAGTFVPYSHLPKRADDLGLPQDQILLLLPVIAFSSIVGRIFFGWIGDFKSVDITLLWSLCTLLCGVSLVLCPFMKTLPMLFAFAATFGIFVGVWTGLKTVVVVKIVGMQNLSRGLGLMLFIQGFANIIGSPLAGWLFDMTGTYSSSFLASGCMFLFSGLLVMGIYLYERLYQR